MSKTTNPDIITQEDVTHRRYFVPVEDERHPHTAVVQMPAVRLALGGDLWEGGSRRGADPPLVAGGGEAGEEVVLQTLMSSRAGRLTLRRRRLGETRATTTHNLITHTNTHKQKQWIY